MKTKIIQKLCGRKYCWVSHKGKEYRITTVRYLEEFILLMVKQLNNQFHRITFGYNRMAQKGIRGC